jgi:hypothetical protein
MRYLPSRRASALTLPLLTFRRPSPEIEPQGVRAEPIAAAQCVLLCAPSRQGCDATTKLTCWENASAARSKAASTLPTPTGAHAFAGSGFESPLEPFAPPMRCYCCSATTPRRRIERQGARPWPGGQLVSPPAAPPSTGIRCSSPPSTRQAARRLWRSPPTCTARSSTRTRCPPRARRRRWRGRAYPARKIACRRPGFQPARTPPGYRRSARVFPVARHTLTDDARRGPLCCGRRHSLV